MLESLCCSCIVYRTTCDFGGTAQLVISPSNSSQITEYDLRDEQTVSFRTLIYGAFVGMVIGCIVGFIVAMKTSQSFNTTFRQSFVPHGLKNATIFTSHGSLFGNENMPMLADIDDAVVDLPMRRQT